MESSTSLLTSKRFKTKSIRKKLGEGEVFARTTEPVFPEASLEAKTNNMMKLILASNKSWNSKMKLFIRWI
jgi:hypothetical protein